MHWGIQNKKSSLVGIDISGKTEMKVVLKALLSVDSHLTQELHYNRQFFSPLGIGNLKNDELYLKCDVEVSCFIPQELESQH